MVCHYFNMRTIKLKNLKKVRDAFSFKNEILVPIDEYEGVNNVVAYGILRRYPEASKERWKVDGLSVYNIYGSYPHAFLKDGSHGIVQKLNNVSRDSKSHMDSMETGAGYDTYEFTHGNKKYHIYIACDSIKNRYKIGQEDCSISECFDGGFLEDKIHKARKRLVIYNEALKKQGRTPVKEADFLKSLW